MTTAGGVVFRAFDQLWFLPASVASGIVPVPEIAPFPGAHPSLVGVAVHDGHAIGVVSVGTPRSCMLVCAYLGESVGLVGVEIEATGRFEAPSEPTLHGESVVHRGERARLFDVASVVAEVFGGRWAATTA